MSVVNRMARATPARIGPARLDPSRLARLSGRLGWFGPALAGLLLAGCSLAGDVTPPPALATAQMSQPLVAATQPPQPVQLTPPESPANLTAGEAIYLDKCAGCHGATGMGDGELAANLQFPPAPLGSPDFARQATPGQWYTAVTVGNLDRFMPPFASLSDSERWAVAGYALSLSVPPEAIEQGETLYESECAGCHGPDGPGLDLTVGRMLVERSAQDLFHTITEGAGAGMPGYFDSLSEDQRWALAAFLQRRDLTAGTSQPEPLAEAPSGGMIRGVIRNGTAGGTVPAGLQVDLHGFDGDQEVLTQTTQADGDGSFTFADLESVPGRLFTASVEYQGVAFQSDLAHLLSDQPSLELPLTIYEPSQDAGPLVIERLHLLLDAPADGVLRVLQLWALTNPTDRVIADPQGVLRIELPDQSSNVQFEDLQPGSRFIQTATGYLDTAPVPPGVGAGDLAFQFDLPYRDRLEYQQVIQHPVQAVVILTTPGSLSLRGDGVQDMGVLDMGGVGMQAYSMGSLAAGEALTFQVSGGPAGSESSGLNLVIGGGTLAIALLLAGLWWYRSPGRRAAQPALASAPPASAPPVPKPQESLLRSIARLDDDYDAGRFEEAEYRARRAELMQQALQQAGPERE